MMHMPYILFLLIAFLTATAPLPAFAMDSQERIDQLERDVLILQRKLSRGGDSSGAVDDVSGMGGGTADVRITALEEEIRSLRGKLEEREFQVTKLSEQLELLKRDVEFRLSDLEQHRTSAAPSEANTTLAPQTTLAKPAERTVPAKQMELSVKDENGETAKTNAPVAATSESPRDQYNNAFRLMNQNQYDEAARSFTSFIKANPNDALVGNAYYWLGETYYIRNDYKKATDQFRLGFEAMPKGPKAADNLLKLGMSLSRDDKKKEACVVLSQVMNKYKSIAANTAAKAESEHKRIQCE